MAFPTRRDALTGLAAAGAATLLPGLFAGRAEAAAKLASLTINGMPATPSVVMARLVETGTLSQFADKVQLKVWRTPDQMRAGVVSGDMAVFGTPSYSCANMLNRGVPVRLMNIVTWGLLYLMSRDDAVQKIEDIAGKPVLMAFRGDAPDLIFRMTLRKLGMNPDTDVKLQYVGTPTEAVQLLLAGRAALAVISEPAATASQIRGAQAGIEVRRAADLTAVWGRLTGRPPRISQAGLGVREDFVQAHPEIVRAIHDGCRTAARWVLDNPAEAGRLGAATLDLGAPVVERSIPHFRLDVVAAADARPDLEHYFTALMEMSPDILGGRLPDDRFYWGPGA
ncbi:ABC transporter substrate-binding protein [Rhodoplanes sp. TEM]|uniref:ABC transporter substrate-binding protein n=1 Tax=Rhodoplanes tepidamans TaxID=200616 RepID=A0ABT5JG39_RHOTP|nr:MULTISPECIES: ABC transporter substrate-binding protein [Rhodoplanes]MDC7788542.1 ABC transporter substrate-binding protein [Rhodoplanes tepidamans]MDC7985141.1 ABC transporter substrate-binding protein [Rhodoplanes sp. TEM]MDQ0353399.1 NitT/TauT family transport system substrate-binding protein [Rhodoplanes tepidamans]